MKKLTLFSVIALSLLSACKKDNSTAKPTGYSINANKNNVAWASASLSTGYVNPAIKDSVLIIAHAGEETLGIKFKSKGVGTYQSTEINAYFWNTVGLDAIVGEYKLTNDASNTLIINSYNEAKNTMTGTFNLTLKKTYGISSSLPDKITFTNGVITADVKSN